MAGISASNKYPRAFITVKFGAGRQSPQAAPRKILLVGYRALVGGSVGTGSDNIAYPLASIDDAITYFGGGSEIHQGADVVLDQVQDATLYGLSYAEAGGGTYSEWTLTITNASVLGGTLTIIGNGQPTEVTIPAATAANDQATAVYNTMIKYKNLPFYCPTVPVANTVVFRWKHKGLRGNQMIMRYKVDSITGSTYAFAQTNVGATDADPTTALDSIAAKDFDFIICGDDSTSTTVGVPKFMTYVNNRADPLTSLRGVLVAAYRGTYANAVTWATAINAHRAFLIWSRNAEDTSMRIAARYGAAVANGTSSDPTANINFLKFKNYYGPLLESDWISELEATNALNNGLSCVRFTPQGVAFVPRPITSRFQDINGNPDYRTLDIGKVLEPDAIADFFEQDIPVTWEGYKLRDDDPNDQGQPLELVMTPRLFKSYMASKLREDYKLGRLKNPEKYINGEGTEGRGLLQAYIHPANGQRIVADLPADIIDIFAQVEMTVRQVG